MKQIYFIRHGESEHNVKGLIAGHTNSPLTSRGRQQAEVAGKQAKAQGLVFEIIVSSPLDRAHHTAQAIARHTGYPLENIYIFDELKERNFGWLEEKTLDHATISSKEYMDNPFAIDHIEQIEKIIDLQFRANQFLEYARKLPHESILIVSHGAFGRALRRAATNAPLTEFGDPIGNAQLIRLI